MKHKRAHQFHKPRGKAAVLTANQDYSSSTRETTDVNQPKGDNWSSKLELSISLPTDAKAVMRKDYFTDDYVIIAPKRHLRPTDLLGTDRKLVETAQSPRLDLQPCIDKISDRSGSWRVMAIDNKFPALTLDNAAAFGKQEIVIDTPLANTPLGLVGTAQLTNVLAMYQKRTISLHKIKGIKYVTVFKNEGIRAGASLAHAHSQIFATPMIPASIARRSVAIEQYFQKKNKNPFDAVIEFEQNQKQRIISDNENFVAFCPFAPRWPLEAWIVPTSQLGSIRELSASQLSSLAQLLHSLISRLTKSGIDYNFYLENGVSPNHRFSIKIEPRSITNWGGFEVATDTILNPIPPEQAASWYRSTK